MNDSIYTIADWTTGTSYIQDDIIKIGANAGTSGFSGYSGSSGYTCQQTLFSNYFNLFFYSLTNHTSSAAFQTDFNNGIWAGAAMDLNGELKPEWVWQPDILNKINHAPHTKNIIFGDSYEQIIKDGINNSLLQIELKFERRRLQQMTAMLHFLAVRQAKQSFLFTPRRPYNKRKRFVARQWSDNENSWNNISLDVRFDEVPN